MKEIRVKLTEQTELVLQEIRDSLNCTWGTAANVAILSGRNASSNGISKANKGKVATRSDNIAANLPLSASDSLYIDIHNNNNSNHEYQKGELIPVDFNPPKDIAFSSGLEHDGALFQFTKWAKAKKKRYPCWKEAFRYACNGWLKDANPHLIISNDHPL